MPRLVSISYWPIWVNAARKIVRLDTSSAHIFPHCNISVDEREISLALSTHVNTIYRTKCSNLFLCSDSDYKSFCESASKLEAYINSIVHPPSWSEDITELLILKYLIEFIRDVNES